MAFENGYIRLASDIKKYNIAYINNKIHFSGDCWTIDRERNIYLRRIRNGREDEAKRTEFSFYWKGTLLEFDVWSEGGGVFKGPCWCHYSQLRLRLRESFEEKRSEIVADIKEALIEYKELGIYSLCSEHKATFDF